MKYSQRRCHLQAAYGNRETCPFEYQRVRLPHTLSPVQASLAVSAAPTRDVEDLVPASPHQLALVCRGAGSRLHNGMKVSATFRFCLTNCRAESQSIEHAVRTFGSRRSWLVLRRWQLRHSQHRLSGMNARIIVAEPIARSTSIAACGPPRRTERRTARRACAVSLPDADRMRRSRRSGSRDVSAS